MKKTTMRKLLVSGIFVLGGIATFIASNERQLTASSHREAPMISDDPVADNTDLYAFRNPDDTNKVVIIANYIPAELPSGGPNYYGFGENVRYEIRVKNGRDASATADDIIYRFMFTKTNQDPTTFFNIRLGQQNLKETYTCQRSIDGGRTFQTIVSSGIVPPNNIGPRSINSAVGLNTTYAALEASALKTATTGEMMYCGPIDDPFFVDLGGIFDLGNIRAGNGATDALACKNVHTIALNIPIATLQKDNKTVSQASSILDPSFVIGVWASASRQKVTVLDDNGGKPNTNGKFVQVSRIGMPLTNEVVIPIGDKDKWNSMRPYNETSFEKYFTNPELALYMDDSQFGTAVPGLAPLRIQRNSLQAFDFGNTRSGLYPLLGNPATAGTALDQALFGNYLLRPNAPRSVDILPIFMTGVPNIPPYQLATGKNGNPLAPGKPFINNFLPTFGDMLRLNMAVPVTQRNDPAFSSLGLVQAAVLGLTDPAYNQNTSLQFIPNMDGFPNGRRLEDDVTRIELQAVGGIVLAAIGLWYDDYQAGSPNPVTTDLLDVYTFTTGVEANDTAFKTTFPFVQSPWNGFSDCKCNEPGAMLRSSINPMNNGLNLSPTEAMMQVYPNPTSDKTNFKIHISEDSEVSLIIFDNTGRIVSKPLTGKRDAGAFELGVDVSDYPAGIYYSALTVNNKAIQTIRFSVVK